MAKKQPINPDLHQSLEDPAMRNLLLQNFADFMNFHGIEKSRKEMDSFNDEEIKKLLDRTILESLFQPSEPSINLFAIINLIATVIVLIMVIWKH